MKHFAFQVFQNVSRAFAGMWRGEGFGKWARNCGEMGRGCGAMGVGESGEKNPLRTREL
jgi:hypothetical protein